MEKWKVKGIVTDEPKSKQQTEQAVLDKAVEKGEIEPEAAGKKDNSVIKVDLDKLKNKEKDAVQKQSTNEVSVRDGSETSKEVQKENKEEVKEPAGKNKQEENNKSNKEEQGEEIDSPIELIKEEENKQPEKVETNQPQVDQRSAEVNEKPEPKEPKVNLPENVDKLVKFMDETGGSIEDYVALNKDISSLKDGELLREYYTKSKPWEQSEISEYMEDNFSYTEDDDPKEIRAKKRAYKEEIHKARQFFTVNRDKYYADIKLKKQTEIPEQYENALKFYEDSKRNEEINKEITNKFLQRTENVFSNDFKGFDFQVGNNKYRYKVNNITETKNAQSDLSNFVGQFLNNKGELENVSGYHKALFTARNADKIAQHFYEQGRADALQQSAKEAKNINMEPRKEGFIETKSGQKFRVVSGNSSSKLRVKLKQ